MREMAESFRPNRIHRSTSSYSDVERMWWERIVGPTTDMVVAREGAPPVDYIGLP
jgi:hypothetical protein